MVRGRRPGATAEGDFSSSQAIWARELKEDHQVLLAAAPTRGLDMAAAEAVRAHIIEERAKRGVLVFSEDLDEILELADTVAVMLEGEIAYTSPIGDTDRRAIGHAMAGAH